MPFDPARLRSLREARGESREHAAVASGCSYSTFVNYERGRKGPSAAVLERIAVHFGVSVDYLLGRVDVAEWVVASRQAQGLPAAPTGPATSELVDRVCDTTAGKS